MVNVFLQVNLSSWFAHVFYLTRKIYSMLIVAIVFVALFWSEKKIPQQFFRSEFKCTLGIVINGSLERRGEIKIVVKTTAK